MKYVVVDDAVKSRGAIFTDVYDDRDVALRNARIGWEYLTDREKMDRDAFFVVETEDEDNYMEGDVLVAYK